MHTNKNHCEDILGFLAGKRKKPGRNSFFARSHSVHYCTICDIQCTGSAITRTAGKKKHSHCELPFFPASSTSQRQHNNKLEAPLSVKHCSSLLHEKQIVFVQRKSGTHSHGSGGEGAVPLPDHLTATKAALPSSLLAHPPVPWKSFYPQARRGEIPCSADRQQRLRGNFLLDIHIGIVVSNHFGMSLLNVWDR